MNQFIFISCGQYSDTEKRLGKQIAELVRATGFQPFLADEVQDLNGLDDNILRALSECAAFITILHPRGKITRPDGTILNRASVWIEQEIAIATYIQHVEKRSIPIIAFRHVSVGREGIRDLLHINPIEFTEESEVLAELPKRLGELLKNLSPEAIQLQLNAEPSPRQDGHVIRKLEVMLVNGTKQRIREYSCVIELPADILKHWTGSYILETGSSDPTRRRFRVTEENKGTLEPSDRVLLASFEYCTRCARETASLMSGLVGLPPVKATIFLNNREYLIEKTLQELEREMDPLARLTTE